MSPEERGSVLVLTDGRGLREDIFQDGCDVHSTANIAL